MIIPPKNLSKPHTNVTFRAIVIGFLLIPVNTYFIMWNHLKYWSTLPTTISLIYNAVISLMILVSLNFLIQRFAPGLALKHSEFMTVYMMLSISSALAGHDMIQTVMPTMSDGFWFATPENEWRQLFWGHLPPWMVVGNLSILEGFYEGESTFYTQHHFWGWVRPAIWWAVFLTSLTWVMICLSALLRKQWIEHERLSYPIIQLPLEMTRPDGRLFKSKMMWLGFAIAGGIDLINGLHVFWPAFPEIPVRQAEIGHYFTENPWDALGWTPLYILSFAVGLGFLMSLEMSFSVWFFYFFWKFERVAGKAFGLTAFPRFPYDQSQVVGGYLMLSCLALYGGRNYLLSIFNNLFWLKNDESHPRWIVWGLIGGLLFLLVFSSKGGLTLWVAGFYFLFYYLLSMGITRVRAEVGPPTNEVSATPHGFLVDVFGSRQLVPPSLTTIRLYMAFNRGSRAHVMPHTLEGFKVADATRLDKPHQLVWVMVLATITGTLAAFWAYLDVGYRIGVVSDLGVGGYNTLRGWLYHPTDTDFVSVAFMGVGALFVGLLWWLRTIFPLWPFHPAGYLIGSSSWTIGWLWFSIFISWIVKVTLLKIGGIRLYRKAYPLFLGLLLGEFTIGGAWVLIRLFSGVTVYSFYR